MDIPYAKEFVIAALLLFGASAARPAQAFEKCAVAQLDSVPSALPMEGSDPIVSGKNVYMAYATHDHVYLEASNDSGRTFTRTQVDNGGRQFPQRPRLAAYQNYLYVAWQSTDESGVKRVYFRQSSNYGASFAAPAVLGLGFGAEISASAVGRGVTVAFVDSARQPVVASSRDGGTSFRDVVTLNVPHAAYEMSVARLGVRIVVTFNDVIGSTLSVLVATSHDAGASFTIQNLTPNQSAAREPLAAFNTLTGSPGYRDAYIYEHDSSGSESLGKLFKSTDGGYTWGLPLTIDSATRQGSVLVDGATVYVSYLKDISGDWETLLTYSLDGGRTFSIPRNVSGYTGITKVIDRVYLPGMSYVRHTFSMVFENATSAFVVSTKDITRHLSKPSLLGVGSYAMIGGRNALWLGNGKVVNYGYCQ